MRAFRVVEYSRGVAAAYCGKLLAEVGCEVVQGPAPLPGHQDLYLNAGKQQAGEDDLRRLAAFAEVVVTDAPDGFEDAPGLVVRVTPFGTTGPYADLPASELVVEALGGLLYLIGTPDREPVKPRGPQAAYMAGANAAVAVAAALFGGRAAGERIDVSELETVASMLENTTAMPQYQGRARIRCGSQLPDSGPCTDIYATKDGFVSLAAQSHVQWESLAGWMGRMDLLDDERFKDFAAQRLNHEAFSAILRDWFASKTTQEAFHEGQEWRIPVGPVNTIADLLHEPQLRESDAWQRVGGGDTEIPGPPWRVSEVDPAAEVPAPVPADVAAVLARWQADGAPAKAAASPRRGPLAGVRVIDLAAVWAGPLCSQILADLGADVIKVEAGVRPDMLRFSTRHESATADPWDIGGWFHQVNRNKRAITLDLRLERGREVLKDLVARADVVVENFSRRVMGNFGLPYEALSAINPRLVMISMPGFGDRGPYRDYVAFGEIIEAMAGLCSLTGYRDGNPLRSAIAFGDPVSGLHGSFAVISALLDREDTGRGAGLTLSHLQGISRCLGEEIVAQQDGETPARLGNRDGVYVPQGVFQCAGDDRWLALSVRSDDEWHALAGALVPDLRDNPELRTAAGRRQQEDLVEAQIAAAVRERDAGEVAAVLQRLGVPAAPVSDAFDLLRDPHLRERGFLAEVEQPGIGRVTIPGVMWHFAGEELAVRRPAPLLGQHTEEVLREVLQLDDATLATLAAERVTSADVPWVGPVGG